MNFSTFQCPEIIGILPAAGIGSRMQNKLPKQYITIGDKTMLEHALGALLQQPYIRHIIIVINQNDQLFYQLPVAQSSRISVVIGGNERANSVMAALKQIQKSDSWVLIHDAARPCLHQDDLLRIIEITAYSEVGGILATPVRDTIKRVESGKVHSIDRNNLWHALTPQLFVLDLLNNCLRRALAEGATVTDDASAIEYCGYQPLLIQGRLDNLKVTFPDDIALASLYILNQRKEN